MDREFVEKVTRIVIEVVKELEEKKPSSNHSAVKIWSHKSPLPDPIVQTNTNAVQPKDTKKMIQIESYVKK